MSSECDRGALIVLEGLDRAGKSTQHEMLCSRLESEGYSVKRMRFPDRTTPIGHSIDAYLRGATETEDHVIHLLFSANRWEVAASIAEHIKRGTIVVVDRYSYSGAVYSAAKNNPSLSLDWAWQPEIGLPRPDLCVFLDIKPELAALRGGYGTERYEGEAMQGQVRSLFFGLFATGNGQEDVSIVDASRSTKQVGDSIWILCENVLTSAVLQMPLRLITGSKSDLSS